MNELEQKQIQEDQEDQEEIKKVILLWNDAQKENHSETSTTIPQHHQTTRKNGRIEPHPRQCLLGFHVHDSKRSRCFDNTTSRRSAQFNERGRIVYRFYRANALSSIQTNIFYNNCKNGRKKVLSKQIQHH